MKGRILVVGLDRTLFEKIEPLLKRSEFVVERVPRASSGLMLASHASFDLIAVRHPLADAALDGFLSDLRSNGPSARTPILVLAEDDKAEEARRLSAAANAEVLSVSEPWKLLEQVASRLLGVAPRVRTRWLIKMEISLGPGRSLVMCQAENISEGGLLVRTDRLHPIGTRLTFDFMPPGERAPIQGEAEVMRHASPDVERVHGLGLRFVSFKGDGQKRLQECLRKLGSG